MHDGTTPAHIASQNGHVEALRILHERGADLKATMKGGSTLAFMASQSGHVETLRALSNKRRETVIGDLKIGCVLSCSLVMSSRHFHIFRASIPPSIPASFLSFHFSVSEAQREAWDAFVRVCAKSCFSAFRHFSFFMTRDTKGTSNK